MRCLFCRYPLEGLASNRCPECGREFDPHDPATFDPTAAPSVLGSHVFWRWALVLTTVPPLGNTAIAALCWFVAAATLGHPPRPGVDDPTYIRSIAWLAPLWQMTGACACTFGPRGHAADRRPVPAGWFRVPAPDLPAHGYRRLTCLGGHDDPQRLGARGVAR